MTYWQAWSGFWTIAATAAFGTAMLAWSPLVAVLAAMAVTLCVVVLMSLAPPPAAPPGATFRRRAARSVTIGAGLVGWSALVSAAPSLSLLAVVLLLTSSPWVVGLAGRLIRPTRPRPVTPTRTGPWPHDTAPAPQVPSPVPATDIRTLDDRQLCSLWRGTFWQLGGLHSAADVLAVVAVRQACLDELERRNPSALHAWLESGARASGGPERFWPHRPTGDADAA